MKKHPTPPPTIELSPSDHQPTKAEMEEQFALRNPDGSAPTMEEIAQAVLQPVKIRWSEPSRK